MSNIESLNERGDVEPYLNFSLEGVGIDGEGRVIFDNRPIALSPNQAKRNRHDKSKKKPPLSPPTNTNCGMCNAAGGCQPTNSVKGCGSKYREE